MQNLPTPLIALIGYVAGLKHHQASDIKPTLYTGTLPAIEKRKADYTYTPLIEINYEHTYFTFEDDNDKGLYKHYHGKDSDGFDTGIDFANYILFTSQYSVNAAYKDIQALLNDEDAHIHPCFISIGDTTTEALHKAGVKDVIQVEKDNRYGVIEWFKKEKEKFVAAKPRYEQVINNRLVFYPHSSLSSEAIPLALQELGFSVDSVVAYNNVLPKDIRRVNLNHFKRIVFTSPSTIDNFIKVYGKLPENTEFITRGPITQDHLEEVLKK